MPNIVTKLPEIESAIKSVAEILEQQSNDSLEVAINELAEAVRRAADQISDAITRATRHP